MRRRGSVRRGVWLGAQVFETVTGLASRPIGGWKKMVHNLSHDSVEVPFARYQPTGYI